MSAPLRQGQTPSHGALAPLDKSHSLYMVIVSTPMRQEQKRQAGHRLPGMLSPLCCLLCHSQRGRLRHCEIIEAPFAYCENCMGAVRQRWE